jgi:hypothetical protein
MAEMLVYNQGGFDPDHPDNNVAEVIDLPDPEPDPTEVAKASALAKLQALGLTEAEARALAGA